MANDPKTSRIIALQKSYMVSIEAAERDKAVNGDYTSAGLEFLRQAALAQASLAKETDGDTRKLHKNMSIQLMQEICETSERQGLNVVPKEATVENVKTVPSQESNTPAVSAKPASNRQDASKPAQRDAEIGDFDPRRFILAPGEVSFGDLIGAEEIVEGLKDKIDSSASRKLFPGIKAKKLHAPLHHLFYGPPGTGKSFLCKAISSYVHEVYGDKGAFFNVSTRELGSKFVGVAEKKIGMLFDAAEEYEFAVICLDEIQNVASRGDGDDRKSGDYTEPLLMSIDGVGGKTNAMVIGCTNYPWLVPSPLLDRLTNLVFLDYPKQEEVKNYLMVMLGGVGVFGQDDESEEKLCAVAAELAVKRHFSYRNLENASWLLFEKAYKKTRKAYPEGNAELTRCLSLTEEEVRDIIFSVSVPFKPETYERYLNYKNNSTGQG